MTVYDYVVPGNVLSFELYPHSVIGSRFENVKVIGTFYSSLARSRDFDPAAMHTNVYPFLPADVDDDYDSYLYAQFQHPNGSRSIIGIPWINPETITISQRGTLKITVEDVGVVERERAVQALAAVGIKPAKVELY